MINLLSCKHVTVAIFIKTYPRKKKIDTDFIVLGYVYFWFVFKARSFLLDWEIEKINYLAHNFLLPIYSLCRAVNVSL